MIYALVSEDGTILNVIVADDQATADEVAPPSAALSVEITDTQVGMGWTYDPEAEAFTAPPEPDPIPTPEV